MLASLQRRFADIKETDFLVLATLLDPQFKDKSFSSSALRQDAVTMLKSQYSAEVEDCQIEEPASKRTATDDGVVAVRRGSVWGCLNEILNDGTLDDVTHMSRESEIDQYLAVPSKVVLISGGKFINTNTECLQSLLKGTFLHHLQV